MLLRLSSARALPLLLPLRPRGGTGGTARRRAGNGGAAPTAAISFMTLPDDRVLRGGLRRFPLLGGGAGMARLSIFEVIHYPVLVFRYFSTRAYTNTL